MKVQFYVIKEGLPDKVTCGQRPEEVRMKSVDIQREKECKYKSCKASMYSKSAANSQEASEAGAE